MDIDIDVGIFSTDEVGILTRVDTDASLDTACLTV